MDDGCNNNLNSTLNNDPQNDRKWPYSGNASLIEPEILEDMGVGMLEDGVANYESTKRSQSEERTILLKNLDNNRSIGNNRSIVDEPDVFGYQEEVYTSSSLEIANADRFVVKELLQTFLIVSLLIVFNYSCRIQQDSYDMDDLAALGGAENESGYSSRMEADYFGDLKENFTKEKINTSAEKNEQTSLDFQFCLFRRKRKPSIDGEDKFNKLSDEIILMILKWLPKKCLVRTVTRW